MLVQVVPRCQKFIQFEPLVVPVATGAIAFALAVLGYVTVGLWLFSASLGLSLLFRTGLFQTRYQREVREAIKVIDRRELTLREVRSDVSSPVRAISALQPPRSMMSTHLSVVQALSDVLTARGRWTTHNDFSSYAIVMGHLREAVDLWEVNCADLSRRTEHCVYEDKVRKALDEFFATQRRIAEEHERCLRAAVAGLKLIVPPSRQVERHEEMLATLEVMVCLTDRQLNPQLSDTTKEVSAIANAIVDKQVRLRHVIRALRGWWR